MSNTQKYPQKFQPGDLVKTLGERYRNHETVAIVEHCYDDKYGKGTRESPPSYSLYFEKAGGWAWHDENELELIEAGRMDLLDAWKAAEAVIKERESNISWIFDNSEEFLKKPKHYSLQALATKMGFGDLWGSRGEGVDLYENSQLVFIFAAPFVKEKDLLGFMQFCIEACTKEDAAVQANAAKVYQKFKDLKITPLAEIWNTNSRSDDA